MELSAITVPSPVPHSQDPQILLILIGLPGSGKSLLSHALVSSSQTSTSSRWVRASQDDAPRRRRQECEAFVRRALAEGYSVVVDRVGFDPIQRSHFIRIAQAAHPRPLIYALTLHVSLPTLSSRLLGRTSHPTLTSPELALTVLNQMQAVFDPPKPGRVEGFDRILELREEDQPRDGIWRQESVERLVADMGRWGHRESAMLLGLRPTPTPVYASR